MKYPKRQYKRDVINQTINFFWTVVCFTPLFWFWYEIGINNSCFYLFLVVALLSGFMPEKILDKFLLSADRKTYERYGIKLIRRFVQNGDFVNSKTRTSSAGSIKDRNQAKRYLKTIAMYGRYHWSCLIFFLLTGIYCFYCGYHLCGLFVSIVNFFYNLAPIFLQQYNRMRITGIVG